ncbi:hypothetical protein JR065_16655 [Xanthomonas sp. AmX2]|uniref:DUF6152 family protein n=1 Tax=Xanthomonas sp. TaxID=29446 RepID=UPI0019812185|nr:DUF6152 family protein [Xanthomonas sp.]MBN6151977.1 hypothetical protein [Xanthomonas sp.]
MRRFPFPSIALPAIALAALLALPASAHHGWSSYDAQRPLRFSAQLQSVQYRNPHAEVEVMYEGKRWNVVLAPIARLSARGLSEQQLTVGKTIDIEGYPRSDGAPELRAERVTVDGKVIELR